MVVLLGVPVRPIMAASARGRPRRAVLDTGRRTTTLATRTEQSDAASRRFPTLRQVDVARVRSAYSSLSQQYIDLVGGWNDHDDDTALVRRHLAGLTGPVLDLGCGPGHWTAHLHALGVDVTGVDVVSEFVAHARTTHPGPTFLLGSMTELDVPDHSVAGVLAWYSTIHLPPPDLDRALAGFRRLLRPSGVLVLGFFDSDDGVAEFDHKVTTAYRWPVDVLVRRLEVAGFIELERLCTQLPERPDRKFAAVAARAC
jgi:ubiquinone/menaquinone biosynthesis C-methylase UbiE